VKLRTQILLLLFFFGLTPLLIAAIINFPLLIGRLEGFYQQAYLQNLRADFSDLDQHLASRNTLARVIARLPEPGILLFNKNTEGSEDADIDKARVRYTEWLNRLLTNEYDIIQISFVDKKGVPRFWLERDADSLLLLPTTKLPEEPPRAMLDEALRLPDPAVLLGPVRLNPDYHDDPRAFLNLQLVSPIHPGPGGTPVGAVVVTLDIGGIAAISPGTLWITPDGEYLPTARNPRPGSNAFDDFPGLREKLGSSKITLYEGPNGDIIWVPMFHIEGSGSIWTGRFVDPSPMARFKNELTLRVFGVVLLLAATVWLAASWLSRKVGRFSESLTQGVQHVLEGNESVQFSWQGSRELEQLSQDLSALARKHAQNNRELIEHARELEASNQYKSEFLANASHELKTPLNSILLLSKLVAENANPRDKEEQRQLAVIQAASQDLKRLIDSLLDLTRIEAGRMELVREEVELAPLLISLHQLLKPQFDAKGLELVLDLPEERPIIISDADKISQIVKNLLSNALKFTEKGRVVLALRHNDGDDSERLPLVISVSDTGIGIPAEKQHRIFNEFTQADGATHRRYGGSGLGLSISRSLAGLLGGYISLSSQPGEGSCFSLFLPYLAGRQNMPRDAHVHEHHFEQEHTQPPMDDSLRGRQILLVGADVPTLLTLTTLLRDWGVMVQAADDLDEALEALRDEQGIDTLLIDTRHDPTLLPALSKILSSRRPAARPRLIALGEPADSEANRKFATTLNAPPSAEALCAALTPP